MEYALEGYGYSPARVVYSAIRSAGLEHRALEALERRITALEGASHRPGQLAEALRRLAWLVERLASRHVQRFPLGAQSSAVGAPPPPRLVIEEPPELLGVLRALAPAAPMNGLALRTATAAKAVFDRMGSALHLTHCTLGLDASHEELLLGVYSPELTAEVRRGDQVAAGVLIALRKGGDGGHRMLVVPRIYRKVCMNGAVAFSHESLEREIEPRLFAHSETEAALTEAIALAVRECIDAKVFDAAVQRCRWSAAQPVAPAGERVHRAILDGRLPLNAALVALAAQLPPSVGMAVQQRFVARGDFTHWGMVNAVTAEAHATRAPLAAALERMGGALLSVASPERLEPAAATARIVANLDDILKRASVEMTLHSDLMAEALPEEIPPDLQVWMALAEGAFGRLASNIMSGRVALNLSKDEPMLPLPAPELAAGRQAR